MKKILSIVLAVLMIVAMIPTVFAASTPVITAVADKTAIKVGDVVTITVSVPKNSKLCALTYELSYNTSEFTLVENSVEVFGTFGFEITNSQDAGKIKYAGAETESIDDNATTLFSVKLKAKKATAKVTATIVEAYIQGSGISEVDVTSAVAEASTKSISFKDANAGTTTSKYISIRTPSKTTIRYKDGIVLHADLKNALPAGATIKWSKSNNNFKTEVSDDGRTCTIISNSNGATTFTATVYSSSGTAIESVSIDMTSKAGFFDILGGFFRGLFGSTKIYAE